MDVLEVKYGHFGNIPFVKNGIEYFNWEHNFYKPNLDQLIYTKNITEPSAAY